MSRLYTTRVLARGGRDGRVRSEDGLLDMALTLPPALGGTGAASNPEQLFAAGYAACFGNAVIHVARKSGQAVGGEDVEVTAEVGIGPDEAGVLRLSVALEVTIAGLTLAAAETVVRAAHAGCPYSNAVRGNVDVAIGVTVR